MQCIPGAPGSARTRPCAAEAPGARPGLRARQLWSGHHQVHRALHQLAGPVHIGCARRKLERRSVRGCGGPPGQPGHSMRPGGHTALGGCAAAGARAPSRRAGARDPVPCMHRASHGGCRAVAPGSVSMFVRRRGRRAARRGCRCGMPGKAQPAACPALRVYTRPSGALASAGCRPPRRAGQGAVPQGAPPDAPAGAAATSCAAGRQRSRGWAAGRAHRQAARLRAGQPRSSTAPPAGTWAEQRRYRPLAAVARCLHATGAGGATRGVQAPPTWDRCYVRPAQRLALRLGTITATAVWTGPRVAAFPPSVLAGCQVGRASSVHAGAGRRRRTCGPRKWCAAYVGRSAVHDSRKSAKDAGQSARTHTGPSIQRQGQGTRQTKSMIEPASRANMSAVSSEPYAFFSSSSAWGAGVRGDVPAERGSRAQRRALCRR